MTPSDSSDTKPKSNFPTFRWLFSWRGGVRIAFFIVICLATLLGLFHAEENVRWRHAWNKYRSDQEAKGQWTDYRSVIPAPVPDNQNFAMSPSLAALFDYIPNTTQLKKTNAYETLRFRDWDNITYAGWVTNQETDFARCLENVLTDRAHRLDRENHAPSSAGKARKRGVPIQDGVPSEVSSLGTNRTELAEMVLKDLSQFDSLSQEIEQAARLPYSRFNLNYDREDKFAILLPHLASIKHFCVVYAVRASAELALGQVDRAFDDVNLTLRLTDTIKDEPFLICYLVRCACYRISLQPVWEGLAQHRWSDAQLKALQEKFKPIHLLDEHVMAMRNERVCIDANFEYWIAHPSQIWQAMDSTEHPANWLMTLLIPRGWFYAERVNYQRIFLDNVSPCVDTAEQVIRPEVVAASQNALAISGGLDCVLKHNVAARMLLPALGNVCKKTAQAQNALDMATIACALERFRLANGHFPEKLDPLAPALLSKIPNDVINGKPLIYRCTADGRFVLYSVAWNEKDDGGIADKDKDSKQEKDWVWQYPDRL